MSTPEPHLRTLPCKGSDFVATAQNFGARMESAKQMWWHIYCCIVTRVREGESVPPISTEEAVRGSLTYGELYDFFKGPNEVPFFEGMDDEQRQLMLNAMQYLTQDVTE